MKALLISLVLLAGTSPAVAQDAEPVQTGQPDVVADAIREFEIALDAYFDLIDERSLATFTEAVSRAARGRLLLEQHLGDDIDNWSPQRAESDPDRMHLSILAAYAERFTGENAVEMWRQDYAFDSFPDAKQELAEWDVLVRNTELDVESR